MPPLPADSIHARACKLKCEKILTRPVYERLENLVTQRHPHFLLISLLQPHGATKQLFAYSKRAVHQL